MRRAGNPTWWATKVRQFRTHLRAKVRPAERAGLEAWVPGRLLALYDAMPVADRRHGLDVVAHLQAAGGSDDPELLLAGLLHDCGKSTANGRGIGLGPRVAWSLSEAFGPWVLRAARPLPGFAPALHQLRDHAGRSADLVLAAGGSRRIADLIRGQDRQPADRASELLRLADEAS
ncbi:MAG TPA: hypothetical protein VKR24_08645 [Candidatus Limnocylindrales bacterium]|nr:hypothetical protein [Candidatus Limnocylindrales bacterium]